MGDCNNLHCVTSVITMRILMVSTADIAGGAEKVASQLFNQYRRFGHDCWLAVGLKRSDDQNVFVIPNDKCKSLWTHLCTNLAKRVRALASKVRGTGRVSRWLHGLGEPSRCFSVWLGHEDFNFPGIWRLLQLMPEFPNIVHCHNLHGAWLSSGGYFDLRALPWLSQQVPVVLTLHDAWLLSGHCAHSFECERWETGCGQCPDLTIYPAVKRDATAYNWQRKRDIYARSRLYVATPCQWLMDKVQRSILASGIVEARVIPNGIDLSVFHPSDRRTAREALGLPTVAKILLFVANGIRRNIWKDYKTMRTAIAKIAERWNGEEILFLALGEDAPPEQIGKAKVQFVPYQKAPAVVAKFYQAADVYIHAARADTFPNTVLEALACGTPVVATAVGGIPEQVDDGQTGFLIPPGNAEAMATRITQLLEDDNLRYAFSCQAADTARRRFNLNRQVEDYLNWYSEILKVWNLKVSKV